MVGLRANRTALVPQAEVVEHKTEIDRECLELAQILAR